MENQTKLLIVDDHPLFRKGILFFLESVPFFQVIGEAKDGKEALALLDDFQVDVILMDLEMKTMDGLTATKIIKEKYPHIGILIFTSFGHVEKIQKALSLGANGYCLKSAPAQELTTAISAIAQGGTYLGKGVELTSFQNIKTQKNHCVDELTKRERDVLEKITQGLSNKEIGEVLFVSEKTIKTHVANILQKMNVKTRTQAALQYVQTKE